MREQSHHSRRPALLAIALACLATPATGSMPPGGYPGQQPPPRTHQPPPQAYPPEGQPQQRQGPPPGQAPAPWQNPQQQQGGYPQQGGPRGAPPPGYRGAGQQQGPPAPQGYSGGGYPPAPYGNRPNYPAQQQQQQDGGSIFSRIANKFKGDGAGGPPPSQYGGYGGQQQQQPPQQQYGGSGQYGGNRPANSWQGQMAQQQPGPGALTPSGPVRGAMGSGGPQQQQQQYNRPPPPQGQYDNRGQQQQMDGEGGGWTGGFKNLLGKVFVGENEVGPASSNSGVPSFRPKGSTLASKKPSRGPDYGDTSGYPGGMYPGGYPGSNIMQPGGISGSNDLQGPGKPEFIAIDKSIVFVLKPNEVERKKRKFKADGQNKLQVIAAFDNTLTSFTAKDGKTNSLRTTELLENNQHVMLQEAAKKIRYLRSEYKRRMDVEGKAMAPADRAKALEEQVRKVFAVAATEGGIHMSSIGPAIESQLDSVPLREGVNDMLGALAYRGIPITVVCTGYGNVAMEVIKKGAPSIIGPGGTLSPHLRLVSNYFQHDEHMTVMGLYDTVPLITDATKNGHTIAKFLRITQMDSGASRPNAVVIGTELADLGLTAGLETVENRITIGFMKMNEDFLDRFPSYAAAYDIVIVGNGDLSYVNEILLELTSNP